jgi:hypothetical protein
MKSALRLFAGFAIASVIICAVLLGLWANDVHEDRKHTVTVNSATPIFVGSGDENCTRGQQLTAVQPGVALRVQRIRYWKECATVDIALPDGRKGHLLLGVGNVSIDPPPS